MQINTEFNASNAKSNKYIVKIEVSKKFVMHH